jgi:predicted PhzF superfamily epimerase YddE/YHI9
MQITVVDAFTSKPFSGNPAAVCVLERPADESWMRHVAREMNLSETAFLVPRDSGWDLRWFTPAVEVDLCGHATLASTHVLYESGRVARTDKLAFHSRSGWLHAWCEDDWLWLDFPALPPTPTDAPPGLIESLGVKALSVATSRFDYLVEVASAAEVQAATPDQTGLAKLGVRGVMLTAQATEPPYDFVSRFFAPGAGIAEDPVTGSAHCVLAPFWGSRLGQDEMLGFQASARGGTVRTRVRGDRVHLGGQAVTTLRGELLSNPA